MCAGESGECGESAAGRGRIIDEPAAGGGIAACIADEPAAADEPRAQWISSSRSISSRLASGAGWLAAGSQQTDWERAARVGAPEASVRRQ